MIVYGDPAYEETLGTLAARLGRRLERAVADGSGAALDVLRALLIEAGQLEQAVWDALSPAHPASDMTVRVTDDLARAFLDCREQETERPTAFPGLQCAARRLEPVAAVPDTRLTVKVPEGFAFYALYPEQYAQAALCWSAERDGATERRAVVVGVRSIGTSLSALVTAVLQDAGWDAHRLTVRPSGHPYARHVELAAERVRGADWALVVDEGPGQSGSSVAAAADALVRAGVRRERIAFLPGHGGGPGPAASGVVRAWWGTAPRYFVPLEALRWDGRTISDCLAALTPSLCGAAEPVARVDQMGGGLWRRIVYADSSDWPAASVVFERPKLRITLGSGQAVLWAFAGLATQSEGGQAETMQARLAQRAQGGWASAALGAALGWVAMPWVEGRRLTRADGSDGAVIAHMGAYLAAVAGPPLAGAERDAAVGRLAEMLYWNVWEALGEAAAERTRGWAASAARWGAENVVPAHGDGRMAPHEWVRTGTGRLLKTDSGGHEADHMAVGRQSVAWDLAGTQIEWGLDEGQSGRLLHAFRESGGPSFPADVRTFYGMAYAAFRVGQCAVCAEGRENDPDDQARLWLARWEYQCQVARLLESAQD